MNPLNIVVAVALLLVLGWGILCLIAAFSDVFGGGAPKGPYHRL